MLWYKLGLTTRKYLSIAKSITVNSEIPAIVQAQYPYMFKVVSPPTHLFANDEAVTKDMAKTAVSTLVSGNDRMKILVTVRSEGFL